MRVLIMELTLDLPLARSLKDKRRLRLRLMERLAQRHRISIAEVDAQDDASCLVLGIAYVGLTEGAAAAMRERLIESVLALSEGEATLREPYAEIQLAARKRSFSLRHSGCVAARAATAAAAAMRRRAA